MPRTSRKKVPAPAVDVGAAATSSTPSPLEGWADLTRDQFGFVLQTTTTMLQSLQALQKAQWDMTQLALERHRELQERAQQTTEIQDLLALQVEMMRFDGEAALRSAQEIYDAAVRTATETLEHARSTMGASQGDVARTWLQSLESLAQTSIRPLEGMLSLPLMRGLMVPGVAVGGPWPE